MTVTNLSPPTITGSPRRGSTLNADEGSWSHDLEHISYAYQWERCDAAGANCVDIVGATSSQYVLQNADIGSTIRVEVTATESGDVPPDPPDPPGDWSGPITITAGGTYNGSWESTSSTPAVRISTTAPVTINGRVRNLNGGPLIDAVGAGAVQLTVSHVFAYGAQGVDTSRFVQAYGFKSVTVRNCTIENTSGIYLGVGAAGSTVNITRNRHHNVQGSGQGVVGNFVQFAVCQTTTAEVSWNEVFNEYNQSRGEDIISIYHSNNVHVFDNMLWHQSIPGNAPVSTQGGITVDASDAGPGCSNNLIERNQVIDGMGIILYMTVGGNGNSLLNNRVVADRLLPNGTQKANGAGSALTVLPGGTNNHAHGNVVGYIDRDGGYTNYLLTGCPEGHAAERANNTTLLQANVNDAAEEQEWQDWLDKVSNAGITLGA